jgi:hypothetical protein
MRAYRPTAQGILLKGEEMLLARSPTVTVRPLTPGHRHAVSRRQLLVGAGAGTLGLLAAGTVGAAPARAARGAAAPRPIPGGIQPFGPGTEVFHLFLPGTGEPSTITDFNGFVGVGQIDGVGAGNQSDLSFEVDNRFFTGEYVALDGRHFDATFGFF